MSFHDVEVKPVDWGRDGGLLRLEARKLTAAFAAFAPSLRVAYRYHESFVSVGVNVTLTLVEPALGAMPGDVKAKQSLVAVGLLLQKTTPVYPPIAKAARVSGTVVLQATISKTGTIENLRVISGPAMLQQAARDAVQQWRYRPYMLNGEPVAVETTVNVIFSLGH